MILTLAQLSDFDRGWLIGLLEGEASFGTGRNETRGGSGRKVEYMRFQLFMADRDVIERAHRLIDPPCKISVRPGRRSNHADMVGFVIMGQKAQQLAEMLLPYMSERRQRKIRDAIETTRLSRV